MGRGGREGKRRGGKGTGDPKISDETRGRREGGREGSTLDWGLCREGGFGHRRGDDREDEGSGEDNVKRGKRQRWKRRVEKEIDRGDGEDDEEEERRSRREKKGEGRKEEEGGKDDIGVEKGGKKEKGRKRGTGTSSLIACALREEYQKGNEFRLRDQGEGSDTVADQQSAD